MSVGALPAWYAVKVDIMADSSDSEGVMIDKRDDDGDQLRVGKWTDTDRPEIPSGRLGCPPERGDRDWAEHLSRINAIGERLDSEVPRLIRPAEPGVVSDEEAGEIRERLRRTLPPPLAVGALRGEVRELRDEVRELRGRLELTRATVRYHDRQIERAQRARLFDMLAYVLIVIALLIVAFTS